MSEEKNVRSEKENKARRNKKLIIGSLLISSILLIILLVSKSSSFKGFNAVDSTEESIDPSGNLDGSKELVGTEVAGAKNEFGENVDDIEGIARTKKVPKIVFLKEQLALSEVINNVDDFNRFFKETKSVPMLKVNFSLLSSEMNSNGVELAKVLLNKIEEFGKQGTINLVGHTCDLGSNEFNSKLSKERVEAVKMFFLSQGVKSQDVVTSAKGEEEFVSSGNLELSRIENRCVTLSYIVK